MSQLNAKHLFALQQKLQAISENDYVDFSITLSDHCWSGKKVKINLYTPKLGHNAFFSWPEAFEFLNLVLEKGEDVFVPERLRVKIADAKKALKDQIETINGLEAQLEEITNND